VKQKETCLVAARDLQQYADQEANFMKTITTGDESWVYGYNPKTKVQSSQWKTPGSLRPKMAQKVQSKVKVMLTVFFDHKGIVRYKYAPEGHIVNKKYYVEILCWLCDAVQCK
jgi:hypothetical protein